MVADRAKGAEGLPRMRVAVLECGESAEVGTAETKGGGNVGAMIGAWGCITQTVAPATGAPSQYLVAVAWQGLNSTAAPAITC